MKGFRGFICFLVWSEVPLDPHYRGDLCYYDRDAIYLTLPLLLAAFFRLSITEGLMLAKINRLSSPGNRALKIKNKKHMRGDYC